VVLGEGPKLTLDDLPARIGGGAQAAPPAGQSYHQAIDAARREFIGKALAEAQGNRAEAARLLGLHKTHLFRLLKALKID
jgi:DNA-binding NtrC family response regulator